jgi:hypothetical protein
MHGKPYLTKIRGALISAPDPKAVGKRSMPRLHSIRIALHTASSIHITLCIESFNGARRSSSCSELEVQSGLHNPSTSSKMYLQQWRPGRRKGMHVHSPCLCHVFSCCSVQTSWHDAWSRYVCIMWHGHCRASQASITWSRFRLPMHRAQHQGCHRHACMHST